MTAAMQADAANGGSAVPQLCRTVGTGCLMGGRGSSFGGRMVRRVTGLDDVLRTGVVQGVGGVQRGSSFYSDSCHGKS